MTIHFYIRYYTRPGQSISLHQSLHEPGLQPGRHTTLMQYLNDQFWHTAVDVEPGKGVYLKYSYSVTNETGEIVHEGEHDRTIDLTKPLANTIECIDTWNFEGAYENAFYTSPFKKVLLADRATTLKTKPPKVYTHLFKVKAPLLNKNEVLCISGNSSVLGDWSKDAVALMTKEDSWWTVKLNIPEESFPLQYKYGIYNVREKQAGTLEAGENRHLHGNVSHHSTTILHDGFARFPNNTWKGAGTAIPVFSLKSRNSFGVGEFTDLQLLADWAKEVGMKLIQILPVNDTTATHTSADSYPYAAISAFALHPIYINLEKVAGKKNAAVLKPLKKKQKELNDKDELDYEQVLRIKLDTVRGLAGALRSILLPER
jgi:4-alpha-glucanotransferase